MSRSSNTDALAWLVPHAIDGIVLLSSHQKYLLSSREDIHDTVYKQMSAGTVKLGHTFLINYYMFNYFDIILSWLNSILIFILLIIKMHHSFWYPR